MKKPKDNPLSVGHHVGEHIYGYDVLADGSVKVSPGFADRMASIQDREAGVLAMQMAISDYVARELKIVAEQKRKWWDHFMLDTKTGVNWAFDTRDGVARIVPPEPEEPSL